MFSSIAIKKKIYACETAQICVGLHIGEVKSLRESSNARHYIFYSVKYFFFVHDYALLLTISLLHVYQVTLKSSQGYQGRVVSCWNTIGKP